jgi:DNA-binding transcriptional regulator YhcF (GntR family)
MNKIIIELNNDKELESLEKYLREKGIRFKTEEEYQLEKQKEAMKVFAEMVEASPKIDISDEEIDAIVEEVRAKRYGKKDNH